VGVVYRVFHRSSGMKGARAVHGKK
jgi:hypothetical protein